MVYSKGQGATEYLVLLAVVLMIALVSIALLGFFPGLAGDAKVTQSASYWKGARPFGITEYSQSTTLLNVLIQNNDPDQRVITAIAAEGGCTVSPTAAQGTFNGGEKRNITIASCTTCTTGNTFEHYVNITYNTNDLTGLKQIGTKPLVGKCA
ncbi:Uncharacterised protein [Candidatus Anstonella stagnisolia]|nr:Uncharacterised protein [Candidatus Anstonella stagnisolia]